MGLLLLKSTLILIKLFVLSFTLESLYLKFKVKYEPYKYKKYVLRSFKRNSSTPTEISFKPLQRCFCFRDILVLYRLESIKNVLKNTRNPVIL